MHKVLTQRETSFFGLKVALVKRDPEGVPLHDKRRSKDTKADSHIFNFVGHQQTRDTVVDRHTAAKKEDADAGDEGPYVLVCRISVKEYVGTCT